MAGTPGSYTPLAVHQPRGQQPWCAGCDTDLHLVLESPAIPGRVTGTVAAALRCSNCRQSRVFDTTAQHLAALTAP